MSPSSAELQDRYRAAVLGFAIGDALGFPLRGLPPAALRKHPAIADEFPTRPRSGFSRGQFSDDTQMLLATANAIAEARGLDGRVVAVHLGWLWEEGTILHPQPSTARALASLRDGTPWMSSGAPLGTRDPGCLSRGIALGLLGEDSPAKLGRFAQVLTVMTHKDPACAAAVAAVARFVQLRLHDPGRGARSLCEDISGVAAYADPQLADEIFYLPRVMNWEPDRAMAALRVVGVSPKEHKSQDGLPPHLTPVLLSAMYAALKFPFDVRQAFALVLRNGGEVDIAAGLTGAFVGVALGTAHFPSRLAKHVLYFPALIAAADALFGVAQERVAVTVRAASADS